MSEMSLPLLSPETYVEPLPLKVFDVTLQHVLVAVLQEMVSAQVELEPRALSKSQSHHHHLECLQLRGEGLLLFL